MLSLSFDRGVTGEKFEIGIKHEKELEEGRILKFKENGACTRIHFYTNISVFM